MIGLPSPEGREVIYEGSGSSPRHYLVATRGETAVLVWGQPDLSVEALAKAAAELVVRTHDELATFHPDAEAEFEDAASFYEWRMAGVGGAPSRCYSTTVAIFDRTGMFEESNPGV